MTQAEQSLRHSRAARASLWAIVLADIFAVLAGLAYLGYLRSVPPNAVVVDLEFVPSEVAYGIAGAAQLTAVVVTAICFIRWFRQAYLNVSTFTQSATRHDPRWAIWGFFVPFLNLVRPQQIMREIWDSSFLRWAEDPDRVAGFRRPVDRVSLWWGLFLASTFAENLTARISWSATTVEETRDATMLLLFSDSFDVVAAVVALTLVRSVTELQQPLLGDGVPLNQT